MFASQRVRTIHFAVFDLIYAHNISTFFKWHVHHRRSRIYALAAIAAGIARTYSVADAHSAPSPPGLRAIFDSDSFDILVDGGGTACISNSLSDFIKPPKASRVHVKGFNGTTSCTKIGTVSWQVLDDTGHRRIFKIPNTYYVPECPLRLFFPQHYSQETRDHRGTYSTNFGDHVLLVWNHGKHKTTLPLSASSNVGILCNAPGYQVFSHFVGPCACPTLFAPAVISNDDTTHFSDDSDDDNDTLSGDPTSLEGDDEGSDSNPATTPESNDALHATPPETNDAARPNLIPFDLDHDNPATNLPDLDDATSTLDAPSELMRWHCRLGHLSFANIQLMAT
jgi:hypothetical protein